MAIHAGFVPLSGYVEYTESEMEERAQAFLEELRRRRTVRDFSDRPVPRNVIETCILAAGTAPKVRTISRGTLPLSPIQR